MPLCRAGDASLRHYAAIVTVPAFNASMTIERTFASIVESIRFFAARHDPGERIAISLVDDASTDGTSSIVASLAHQTEVDVYLTVNDLNGGRARARNRGLAVAEAASCLFLDHDDEYLPEHVAVCLDALASDSRVDFVKTGVRLSDWVHPDWEPRIAASLTQNLCVRAGCHRLVGGFQEEPEVEAYGCDDVLYNRVLRACFRSLHIARPTVTFVRRPGNSFDRQYERKFSRPEAEAEITLSPVQLQLRPRIDELYDARLRAVRGRLRRLAVVARGTPSRGARSDTSQR